MNLQNSVQGTVLVASTLWSARVASAAAPHTRRGESLGCVSPCPGAHRTALEMPQPPTRPNSDPICEQVTRQVTGSALVRHGASHTFLETTPSDGSCSPMFYHSLTISLLEAFFPNSLSVGVLVGFQELDPITR